MDLSEWGVKLSERMAFTDEKEHIAADRSENTQSFTIVLESASAENEYHDTPLPFAGSRYRAEKEAVPEKIRQMRRLYDYSWGPVSLKARNFVRQGRFMEDYEDDYPWTGEFLCYFPTYHDLTIRQLRGYFSWRSHVRKGDFQPIAASAAYLYIYELLNGIGASCAEESLRKLKDFEKGFLDSGIGDRHIRPNLMRWMTELAVVRDLPPETAVQFADPALLRQDAALTVLKDPERYSDEEVFAALCTFGGKRLAGSPVISKAPERGRHLFCEVWRTTLSEMRDQGRDLFKRCFGAPRERLWIPLANAVFLWPKELPDRDYILDECRIYRCRGGIWRVESYDKTTFNRERFQSLMTGADQKLRRYLKTGRYLRERPEDAWAAPFIEAVMQADKKAALEAARPKITIDFSGLDRIRREALLTRDSLLTEEELAELEALPEIPAPLLPEEEKRPALPLSAVQIRILTALLQGGSAEEIVREEYLTPSLAADAVNEALFDEFADIVLLCEDDKLSLVEDYTEDLAQMLGGVNR